MRQCFLRRTGAPISIGGVGDFPTNTEREVSERIYREFRGSDGWEGRVMDDAPASPVQVQPRAAEEPTAVEPLPAGDKVRANLRALRKSS